MRKYFKKLRFSYTLGVYPTLELIRWRPKSIRQIILHSRSAKNEGVLEIKRLTKIHKVPLLINDEKINSLSVKENCLALGLFNKYESSLEIKKNHLCLMNPRNMGNLGTILRTALGFGVEDIALIKPAADVFDPKVIRSAMGATFRLNIRYFNDFDEYVKEFANHRLYALLTNGKKSLWEINFDEPFSLIFGNESNGLPKRFRQFENTIFVPQTDKIDSLNLAVSVGIVLYEANKKI